MALIASQIQSIGSYGKQTCTRISSHLMFRIIITADMKTVNVRWQMCAAERTKGQDVDRANRHKNVATFKNNPYGNKLTRKCKLYLTNWIQKKYLICIPFVV